MKIRFGHDGWHGVLAHDVTFDRVHALARVAGVAMCLATDDDPRLVVGFDRRFLAEEMARSVAAELAAIGIEIWLIPMPVPTPVVSHTIESIGAAGGLILTAAHLPPRFAGVKLRGPDGSALPSWMIQDIEFALESDSGLPRIGPTATVAETDPVNGYLAALSEHVPVRAIQNAGITIAVDPMFGTASELLPRLIDGNGSRCVEIRAVHNPRFPGLSAPDTVDENLGNLRRVVENGAAAFGIAVSGDGSTIAAIDEHGAYVSGEQVFALVAYHLLDLAGKRGAIARTVDCSTLVSRLADAYGVHAYEARVGFGSVAQLVRDHDILVAGDVWGGVVYPAHLSDRDGLLAGMLLSAFVVESGSSISELMTDLREVAGDRSAARRRLALTDDQQALIEERMQRVDWPEHVAGCELTGIATIDGIRLEMAGGEWLLIRHDPCDQTLDLVAEAHDDDTAQALIEGGRHLMLV